MYTILLVIHTIIVLFLIMMVLIQRSDSDGMGGLGGGGGNQFMTGRATANLMTRTTAILAAAFMISSLVLAVYAGRMTGGSIIDSTPTEQSLPLQSTPAKNVPEAQKSKIIEKTPVTKPAVPKPE